MDIKKHTPTHTYIYTTGHKINKHTHIININVINFEFHKDLRSENHFIEDIVVGN